MAPGKISVYSMIACALLLAFAARADQPMASVKPPSTSAGYLARLLINENPFPGERGFVGVADTKAGMLSILHVLDSRLRNIPPGYRQPGVAGIATTNIIDIITAPNQCEGFSRGPDGKPAFATRVEDRLNNLLRIANSGGKPGRFAELINYAQGLADAYIRDSIEGADRFAGLTKINQTPVTGRAFSWMTDMDCYNPGGNFVRITDDLGGATGGNRYFTLRKEPK